MLIVCYFIIKYIIILVLFHDWLERQPACLAYLLRQQQPDTCVRKSVIKHRIGHCVHCGIQNVFVVMYIIHNMHTMLTIIE